MTNLQRLEYIGKEYGKYVDTCVKQQGEGWYIKLKHPALIQLNKNSDIVKGKSPGGLLEALVVLQKLVKTYATVKQATKAVKQQPSKN